MVTLPLSIVAAAMTIQYWNSPISSAVWVSLFLLLIIGINLLGVSGFGEAEFYFSLLKILAIVGFMFVPFSLPFPTPINITKTAFWALY